MQISKSEIRVKMQEKISALDCLTAQDASNKWGVTHLFNHGNIRYNNQVKDYNKGAKHDDAPDSLYGAVQLIEGVKSIRFFDRSLLF